ncbi:MAG: NUDIX domain-containing protein [Planctomycetes bacterium]|nr:NUDIX domain-containing protein [Planctomycetota bacterium]
MTHLPADATSTLTHAGGVVHRTCDGVREFLLVTSSKNPAHWVLPKGHIDPGETPEATAVREVREESGVRARLEEPLFDTELALPSATQRVRWFLLERTSEGPADEGRSVEWLAFEPALARLSFEDARRLVVEANKRLAARGSSS